MKAYVWEEILARAFVTLALDGVDWTDTFARHAAPLCCGHHIAGDLMTCANVDTEPIDISPVCLSLREFEPGWLCGVSNVRPTSTSNISSIMKAFPISFFRCKHRSARTSCMPSWRWWKWCFVSWCSWIRASWYNYESNEQYATIQVNP